MAIPDEDDSFCPSNDRLVDRYLRAKLDGKISDLGAKAAYFVDADVCSARPEDLVRRHGMPASVKSRDAADCKQWYFFSPVRLLGSSLKKKSRTVAGTGDKESWHAEGSPKPIEGSVGGGYVTQVLISCEDRAKNSGEAWLDHGRVQLQERRQGSLQDLQVATRPWSILQEEGGRGHRTFDELEKLMMTDVEDEATTLQVPEGEDPEAFYMGVLFGDEEHAAIQTVQGPLTDGDVIAALASGVTLGELLLDGPSSPHPGYDNLGVPLLLIPASCCYCNGDDPASTQKLIKETLS
ncbi:hypothetical protein PR202_ga25237 [Eleusine coracana subsp. coracana]|uniref:NAC domain-containing protein n=1 Tax=Eleusine coracana subsp. coracana TaxID=191504 RepID=A0AAV5D8Y7_ELECO|nr:hypothetical protein PR202_ga25237 [Eleusine coracana subsp. coracana]